jgi:transposase
VTRQSVHR